MSLQDDSARDSVRSYAEPWVAASPFVSEAAEEEQAPIDPWYQGYTPFVEGREPEEMYTQEADWESDLAALEAESPFQHTFEQPGVLTADAEMERAEAFEDEFAFEEPGIIRGDNRVRVKKTDGVPWRWICKISTKDNQGRYYSDGTGVLISHKHVLTAAHVVYPEYIDPYNYSVEVIPALNEGDEPFSTYTLSAKPKIPKNYDPKAQDHLD
jgi:V8-like Glu-specific endopeptidase